MLHALQEYFGYIDRAAVPLLAETLNLSRAEVVGVINFYHDFRQEPPGAHTLQVCRAEACQSMGCEALLDHVRVALGIDVGETTADGAVSLKAVYCLGNCALSPAVMLDGRLYGRVSTAKADRLLAEARS
jgi:formate dehydrogenase subunit gamma